MCVCVCVCVCVYMHILFLEETESEVEELQERESPHGTSYTASLNIVSCQFQAVSRAVCVTLPLLSL